MVCNLPVLVTTTPPTPEVWPWLSGVLVFGPLGMYLGIVAVRYASASSLGPYTLLRLVIASIGGIVLFGETPDPLSWLGVADKFLSKPRSFMANNGRYAVGPPS